MREAMLAALELRRYRRGHLARAAIIAIILLPLLYGTVYLAAFWNPYDNLSGLPVVLVNEDKPAKANGQTVNAGAQLEQTLLKGADFDWSVESMQSAAEGMEDGTYYFELIIPRGFSSAIASLGTTKPRQAKLALITNEANNYITSLIAEQAGAKIAASVGQNVIEQFVNTSLSGIITIRQNLNKAAVGAGELAAGVDELKDKTAPLPAGTAELAAGNAEVARVADTARGYAKEAENVVANLVQRQTAYVKAHPTDQFARDILTGLIYVQSQVDATAQKIIEGSEKVDLLATGSEQLAQAAIALVAGIQKLDVGASQLSAGLESGVAQIPNWTPAQVGDIANHVSLPVGTTLFDQNDPGSYGAGFAPYFLSMSLWVGLLIVFMLLQPLPKRVLMAGGISAFGATSVGYLAVIAVSIAQVAVLLTVVRYGLGITPVHGWGIMAFMLLVSLVYAAILQLLNAALGPAGRLVALVLLMLQLTSSGGTYPIETSPAFFQAISPFLPMTYVVRGIRHLIGGGSIGVTLAAASVLVAFGVAAFALSVLVASRQRRIKMDDLKPELSL